MVQGFVERLDPQSLRPDESKELFDKFVVFERVAAAGKSLTGLSVADSRAWWTHKSPAHFMADKSKCSVGHAAHMLNTVEDMKHLPATDKAFRRGALTELQAMEVVSAAMMDNASQEELLEYAELESLANLRRQASRVRAAAMSQEQKHQRAFKHRHLRHWIDIEGCFRLDLASTPAAGAVLLACLQQFFQDISRAAAKEGIKERSEAHMADALVAMAEHSRSIPKGSVRPGPSAVVHLRMDYAALERGHLESGEICEVPGVGPIPLEEARALLADSYRVGVLMDGQHIMSVKGLGHSIPDRLRRAVYERDDYRCVVPGCCTDYTGHQIDHVKPVARGGPTKIYNLALLCVWHHGLKTHHCYTLKHYKHRWMWWGPHDPPPEERNDQLVMAGITEQGTSLER